MEFEELMKIVGDEPVFESSLLLAGEVKVNDVRRQLSRWTRSGKIYPLRRGLYALAPPYQKVKPHPFVIANRLKRGSYVSCQSALAYYDVIPEYVPRVVSVTTTRPAQWETPFGIFEFRHLQTVLFFGYHLLDLGDGQRAWIARPEKALLDLAYLFPGADSLQYLRELRLQNLDRLDLHLLEQWAERSTRPKLMRAVANLRELIRSEAE